MIEQNKPRAPQFSNKLIITQTRDAHMLSQESIGAITLQEMNAISRPETDLLEEIKDDMGHSNILSR